MAKKVAQYDLLISCPGDIEDEISIINKVVKQFNEQFSDVLDINVRTKHWTKNSYPESGGEPQKLLNKQLVKDCDAAIAIFWTRFGTPTDEYGSGTEEEIEEMIEAGKQVFMYFSEKPLPPSKTAKNMSEYNKVCEFRERYKSKGLYYTYCSDDEFSKQLFAHISQYFLSLKTIQDTQQQKSPKLSVQSITNMEFSKRINPCTFNTLLPISPTELLIELNELYVKIDNEKCEIDDVFEKALLSASSAFEFLKPVEIDDDTKNIISSFAKSVNHALSTEFFLWVCYVRVRYLFQHLLADDLLKEI